MDEEVVVALRRILVLGVHVNDGAIFLWVQGELGTIKHVDADVIGLQGCVCGLMVLGTAYTLHQRHTVRSTSEARTLRPDGRAAEGTLLS